MSVAEAKLHGTLQELNTHKVQVDKELDNILDKTQDTLFQIDQKINGMLKINQRLQTYKNKKSNSTLVKNKIKELS